MLLDAEQPRNNNTIEVGAYMLDGLDLKSGHGQAMRQVLHISVKVNEFPEPVDGKNHNLILSLK
ncbi:MAG: hypothetical protein Kow00100_16350 [Geothermobacteraceae bacterium]